MEVIRNWNNLENKLTTWCNDKNNLPTLGQPWHLKFSAFKTDKCMNHPQAYHLDVGPKAYCYKKSFFPFSMMIGIEDYTFLDYKDLDDNCIRVCLQRGDMFLFRGDVPHGGTENSANHVHYRIHVYVDSDRVPDKLVSNEAETIPFVSEDHVPYVYDESLTTWKLDETYQQPQQGEDI